MKLGIYVGSFDPIHVGHIKVMDYLIEKNYLDKIVIIPTLDYWYKKNLTDINVRCDMIKLIKRDYLILDEESNKYKYTFELLRELKKKYINDELFLIIAADNIITFHNWKNVLIQTES